MDNFWKFATVAVGVVAAYIAFQQFWLARERLRLDLFEKRFAVFAAVRRFLSLILQGASVKMDDFWQYRAGVAEASFLFDEDITDYLGEIDRRALRAWRIGDEMKEPEPNEDLRVKRAGELSKELQWLTEQLAELKPRLAPYMKFREWHWTPWSRRRKR